MSEVTDYTPEKQIKEGINRYLRFLKSEKRNLRKNHLMFQFIKVVDRKVSRLLLNDDTPIYERAKQAYDYLENYKGKIGKRDTPCQEQKIKHLNIMQLRLRTLLSVSKKNKKIIISRGVDVEKVIRSITTNEEEPKYNTKCKYYPTFIENEGVPDTCSCGMDMTFCNKNCGYATTNKLATKAYEADTIIHGGVEGSIVWNKNGRGLKSKNYKPAHTKRRCEYESLKEYRYNDIERYSAKGHVESE